MAGKNGVCVLCGQKEIECPSTDTCKNCYSVVLNWSKRSAQEVNQRAMQLGLYQKRMMVLTNATDTKAMQPAKVQLKAMPGKIKLKEFARLKGKYKKPTAKK